MGSDLIKILLVEDNPGDARLIREMLAEVQEVGFEIDWVTRLSEGLERLTEGEIDLVLLDLGLPDSRGLETFVKAYAQAPQVPLVVLTGLTDETMALAAVRQGAQDFLVKGQTDGIMLFRAIRYATERKKIEEDLRQAHDELERRVAERTVELAAANLELQSEILQRRQAERALQLAHDDLELKVARRTAELARANDWLRQENEERRAAEMALEAERQRLFALLDGLPAMVHLAAPDFSFRFGNRVFREVCGDWEGKKCFEVVARRSEPCQNCPSVRVFETGVSKEVEWVHPNGEQTFQLYKYPFADVDGTPLVLTLGINITKRKRAEMALEAERQRLFALLDGLPGLVYLKAADYSIRFANRSFRETCGDWEGKKCYEAIFKTEQPCENCTHFRVLKTGVPSVKEAAYGGSDRIYQIHSYPFADVDGTPLVLTLGIDITQRKQAEERLRQSEARLSEAQRIAKLGRWEWDIQKNESIWSEEMFHFLGLPPQTQGPSLEDYLNYIHPEDREMVKAALSEALTGKPYKLDIRYLRSDGTIRHVHADGEVTFAEDGRPIRMVGANQDITERKEVEEALRQSQARLAKAQSLAHLGHWEWNLQTEKAIWSEEMYRIFGVDPKRFSPSQDAILSRVHPEDQERVSNCLNAAMTGVKPYNVVNRIIRPDGSVRYVHAQAEVLLNKSGKPRRMLGTAQDITERRIAEMRLRDSEARFRAIFEGAAVGIGLTDMTGRFLTANKTLQDMLGYSEDELAEQTCLGLTHADDAEKSQELFRELESGERDHLQMQKRFQRKDGQYFWARVTVSLVKNSEGQPLYAVGMVEDVTQAKKAEERLQESEKRLRFLASQLMTAQEDERKRISRELHDELGQSLLVLKLQARGIEKALGGEQQRLRAECQEMLANFDQVVDNVRRLSRDLSPTILEDLGLTAALQYLTREFGKRYHIEYCAQETNIDDLFPLDAQVTIYRIFQESLTNIGKHSQATLLTFSISKTEDRVSFLIQDNGKGFNPVQRRRQDTERGLGLASMEERARMVGGVLTIWSQEDAGTRISFDIPFSPKIK